jgi:hypothetical protein
MLKRGARRRLGDERGVALSEVLREDEGQPARARLEVAVGPTYLQALLPAGGRVEVGGTTLEVLAVESARAIRIRLEDGGPADAPLRALETGGPRLRLAGLGLYALPDGVRLGVGNVRREGRGPGARAAVTLTVFPAAYARDPTLGYDLHLDLGEGAVLEGQVLRGKVLSLDPAAGPGGEVELEVLPPG